MTSHSAPSQFSFITTSPAAPATLSSNRRAASRTCTTTESIPGLLHRMQACTDRSRIEQLQLVIGRPQSEAQDLDTVVGK